LARPVPNHFRSGRGHPRFSRGRQLYPDLTVLAVYVVSFYRLYGDTQGHRTVDATDVAVLFGTFGKHAGDDGFVSYLDYNGDGVIDDGDLYAFIARYGTTLNP
jgi:hypothetical protein